MFQQGQHGCLVSEDILFDRYLKTPTPLCCIGSLSTRYLLVLRWCKTLPISSYRDGEDIMQINCHYLFHCSNFLLLLPSTHLCVHNLKHFCIWILKPDNDALFLMLCLFNSLDDCLQSRLNVCENMAYKCVKLPEHRLNIRDMFAPLYFVAMGCLFYVCL